MSTSTLIVLVAVGAVVIATLWRRRSAAKANQPRAISDAELQGLAASYGLKPPATREQLMDAIARPQGFTPPQAPASPSEGTFRRTPPPSLRSNAVLPTPRAVIIEHHADASPAAQIPSPMDLAAMLLMSNTHREPYGGDHPTRSAPEAPASESTVYRGWDPGSESYSPPPPPPPSYSSPDSGSSSSWGSSSSFDSGSSYGGDSGSSGGGDW